MHISMYIYIIQFLFIVAQMGIGYSQLPSQHKGNKNYSHFHKGTIPPDLLFVFQPKLYILIAELFLVMMVGILGDFKMCTCGSPL